MPTTKSADGTLIAYDRSGSGRPVILVDGALCSRTFGPMPKLAPLLAEHFSVFTYDRRGRNESGDTRPYEVDREVDDLDAVIREAGGSAYVLGLSSGAALALTAAARGLAIEKMVIYEPPFMVAANGRRPPADHREQLTRMIADGRRGDAVKFFLRKMVGVPAFMVMMMRVSPFWSRLEAVAHTLPYDAAVMGDFSLPAQRIHAIGVPTLVAGGGKSPQTLRDAVDAVAAALPRAQRRILDGQTHNVAPKVLAPVVREFFAA